MKRWMILSVLLFLLIPITVEAKEKPLPYRIDTPHIVEKNHKVSIEWRQTEPVLVTVYKLSYDRKLKNNCAGLQTLGANCQVLWERRGLVGNIRVTDRNYRNGDQYFIQQNVYQTHNAGYGPFYPTYR